MSAPPDKLSDAIEEGAKQFPQAIGAWTKPPASKPTVQQILYDTPITPWQVAGGAHASNDVPPPNEKLMKKLMKKAGADAIESGAVDGVFASKLSCYHSTPLYAGFVANQGGFPGQLALFATGAHTPGASAPGSSPSMPLDFGFTNLKGPGGIMSLSQTFVAQGMQVVLSTTKPGPATTWFLSRTVLNYTSGSITVPFGVAAFYYKAPRFFEYPVLFTGGDFFQMNVSCRDKMAIEAMRKEQPPGIPLICHVLFLGTWNQVIGPLSS